MDVYQYVPTSGATGVTSDRKSARGVNIDSWTPNPGYGTEVLYDQSVAKTPAPTRLLASQPPPALYGTSLPYDNSAYVRSVPATGAIENFAPATPVNPAQSVDVPLPRPRPSNIGILSGAIEQMPTPVLNNADAWADYRMGTPAQSIPGLVTGGSAVQPAQQQPTGLLGFLAGLFNQTPVGKLASGISGAFSSGGGVPGLSLGGHDTSSPEAFAADVRRPTNVPGAKQFTGKVEQGSAGQNRYGSTAHNELLALFG